METLFSTQWGDSCSSEEGEKKNQPVDRRVLAAVFSERRCSLIHVPQSVRKGAGYCTTQLKPPTHPANQPTST